ncbi:hypothetical protein N3K63_01585 [Microbacterium sp. W1N]|uniref:hypothetical protein n=1 Tax=Microbacterium festucae TaxID=2977531 RepID=UPI0021C03BDF|nr:hypothetical protein [Microbacterium festucae]MCT9818971.1 hypothetical protein [Microbacterium festucae]
MSTERTSDAEPREVPAAAADAAAPAADAAAPAAVPAPSTRIDVPGDDVELTVDVTALPGEHRGGYSRAMTAPVDVPVPVTESVHLEEVPPAPVAQPRLIRTAPWALLFGVLGLVVSLVVGWGFLIGVLGAGLALFSLRRPWENRAVAVWALCLSVVSLLYSAGWLWWASTQGPLFG